MILPYYHNNADIILIEAVLTQKMLAMFVCTFSLMKGIDQN
jgi:hypothetical protein